MSSQFQLRIIKVKASGEYLVNDSSTPQSKGYHSFAEVISEVCEYAKRPEIFDEEPYLDGLSKSEEKAIRSLRSIILEKEER
jgi:hypothetical protein